MFSGIKMSAARKRVVVVEEGHVDSFLPDVAQQAEWAIAITVPINAVENNEIDLEIFYTRNNAKDIARVWAEGF
jgi:hypothetical protein